MAYVFLVLGAFDERTGVRLGDVLPDKTSLDDFGKLAAEHLFRVSGEDSSAAGGQADFHAGFDPIGCYDDGSTFDDFLCAGVDGE